MLQHLLGDDVTVPPDRGLFLAKTYRLRPELCAFTSDAYYEGRLGYAPDAAAAVAAVGNGPAGLPSRTPDAASRRSRRQTRSRGSSPSSLGTGVHGRRRLRAAAHRARTSSSSRRTTRRCGRCARAFPTRFAVGTVDKFQGQQAPGRDRLDGELDAGGRTARDRVRVRPAPVQRRDVAGAVPGDPRLLAAAPRRGLQDGRADAARQRGVRVRRARSLLSPRAVTRRPIPLPTQARNGSGSSSANHRASRTPRTDLSRLTDRGSPLRRPAIAARTSLSIIHFRPTGEPFAGWAARSGRGAHTRTTSMPFVARTVETRRSRRGLMSSSPSRPSR